MSTLVLSLEHRENSFGEKKPVKKGQMKAKKSIFILLLVYSVEEAV